MTEKYEKFKKDIISREIEPNEIVFDADDRKLGFEAINFIALNLYSNGYCFEIYYAEGQKSPHLHLKDICFLEDLDKEQLKQFKRLMIKKYTPKEYYEIMDLQVCNPKHLIAEENKKHYKYKTTKKLLHIFNEKRDNVADEELKAEAKLGPKKRKYLGKNTKDYSGVTISLIAEKYGFNIINNRIKCPFHNGESSNSLSLNDEQNIFNCFGCDAQGDIIKFVQLMEDGEKDKNN